jgi:hypothetical protein
MEATEPASPTISSIRFVRWKWTASSLEIDQEMRYKKQPLGWRSSPFQGTRAIYFFSLPPDVSISLMARLSVA